MSFEVFKGEDGWYWRLKDGDDEVAVSNSYALKREATAAAKAAKKIIDEHGGP